MCGIFGAINSTGQWNQGTIRALAWANRERGTDSMGLFDSTGKMTKRAQDPKDVLALPAIGKWLSRSESDGEWFVAGHTRFATRGTVNRKNSHPFRYGKIIGSHNGCVDAPFKFRVDSEYLFYSLNKNKNDWNKALGDIGGYWGLSWFDGTYFYLCSHHGELHVCEVNGVYYYSSDDEHLAACTGGTPYKLKEGEVWRFDCEGNVVKSTDDDPAVPKLEVESAYGAYGAYGGYSGKYAGTAGKRGNRRGGTSTTTEWSNWDSQRAATDSTDSSARDYDAEWMEAWSSYCSDGTVENDEYASTHKSIHAMDDAEYDRYSG